MTVVLRDTLTKGERSLVNDDRAELVLSMRFAFSQTMREARSTSSKTWWAAKSTRL